jgi:hypothetical protein
MGLYDVAPNRGGGPGQDRAAGISAPAGCDRAGSEPAERGNPAILCPGMDQSRRPGGTGGSGPGHDPPAPEPGGRHGGADAGPTGPPTGSDTGSAFGSSGHTAEEPRSADPVGRTGSGDVCPVAAERVSSGGAAG